MEYTTGHTTVKLKQGDITRETTDALVNAANSALRGGGGVDGAIHRAGGPRIMEECRAIGGCPAGEAVITTAGNMKARHVIHTVGPIWQGGGRNEEEILYRCYYSSLSLALQNGIESISFPSISTGAYGYPLDRAAPAALEAILDFVDSHEGLKEICLVLFDGPSFEAYQRALENLIKERNRCHEH